MSYGGFEYGNNQSYGGFDPMYGGGGGGGAYGMDMGGGGFMAGGEADVKSSEKKKVGDRQSLISVTIKQLRTAERQGDSYIVDGRELHTVQLVGTFTGLEEHSTNIVFKLNDGTDLLECRQWIDKESLKHKKISNLKPGSMVRVVGNIRDYEGDRHVLVFEVFPLEDFNQLTHHILDVIFTHCKHSKGPIPGSAAAKALGSFAMASPGQRAAGGGVGGFNANMGMQMGGQRMMGGGASLAHSMKAEAQGVTESVYQAYTGRGPDNQEGLHMNAALSILRGKGINMQPQELMQHVRQLCDDGRLYSTVDDEHHKPTSEDF